ncbi:hypothetical protein BGX26_010569 [Mortierella sp. AD094]|nr:hypothetical protein BGX26_010569 [Mortierella sp. AD094]
MNINLSTRSLYGEEKIDDGVAILFGTKSLQFPLAADGIAKIPELVETCVPSGFGMNARTVIDPSYRNCKELRPKNFAISNAYHEILPKIVTQVANILEAPKPIYASLNKLCVYETHGFFKEHVDTPQPNIFASLVVCLPTDYEGGMLVVEDSEYDLSSASSIKWCAFYSDCKHRIDEVTKGFRMTLTYDLLYVEVPEPTPYHDLWYKTLESSLLELYAKNNVDPALAANQKPKFVIGIPLASQYPCLAQQTYFDTTGPFLKGIDLRTLTILRDLGYTTDIKAVYGVEKRKVSAKYMRVARPAFEGVGDIYEEEEFTKEYYDGEEAFVITDVWNGWDGEVDEQYGHGPIEALYISGGRILKNVVWLWNPTFRNEGPSYIAYGNEASTGTVYMDGCVLAYK